MQRNFVDRKLLRLAYWNASRAITFPTDTLRKDHRILGDESPSYNFLVCFFLKRLIAYSHIEVGSPPSMRPPTTLPFAGWNIKSKHLILAVHSRHGVSCSEASSIALWRSS